MHGGIIRSPSTGKHAHSAHQVTCDLQPWLRPLGEERWWWRRGELASSRRPSAGHSIDRILASNARWAGYSEIPGLCTHLVDPNGFFHRRDRDSIGHDIVCEYPPHTRFSTAWADLRYGPSVSQYVGPQGFHVAASGDLLLLLRPAWTGPAIPPSWIHVVRSTFMAEITVEAWGIRRGELLSDPSAPP